MKVKMEVTESFDDIKLSKKTIHEVAKSFELEYGFKVTHISDDKIITVFVDHFVLHGSTSFSKFFDDIKMELRRLEKLKKDMKLIGMDKCKCGDK